MATGYNDHYGGAAVYVDMSHLVETVDEMKKNLSEEAFREVLRRTFVDASKKVKTIVGKQVPKKYDVTQKWVQSAVGWPKITVEDRMVQAVVPIMDTRGSIGGRFTVDGIKGRPSKKKRRRYKIKANVVRGQKSIMPDTMAHQGGNPPFVVWKMNGGKNNMVFTRKYKHERKPIVRVVGIGVPQMPLNRSRDDVEGEILKVIENRMPHHYKTLYGK